MSDAGSSRAPSRLRSLSGLIAATVLLPLALVFLGFWEKQRGASDWAAFEGERLRLVSIVSQMEAQVPPDGRIDFRLQFRLGNQNYGGPLALAKARETRDEVTTLTTVMDWRRILPLVVIAGGVTAAALSILMLCAGTVLGWLGRLSRDALITGFSLVRLLLPVLLSIQILAATAAFVAAVTFESGLLLHWRLDAGTAKLLGLAIVAVGGTTIVAFTTLRGLRKALAAFEPEPLPVAGRIVTPAQAPGLWQLTERLAQRLEALRPETIVVGLTGGFFVSSGRAVIEPGGTQVTGRILYLPLPYLALLRGDEVAAIIGHELAHYAGEDTLYSQRFLPIYAGVERSLDAVAQGHRGSLGLLGPSLRLGIFMMDRFHLAVRHWSRRREFEADAVGAAPVSTEAAARALLRIGAVEPRLAEILERAAAAPHPASADLVAAALQHAIDRGLDDPAAHLEAEQSHPTDTHPPTRERVAALRHAIDDALFAKARARPQREALDQLQHYFADPAGICQTATSDFLDNVREHSAAEQAHLKALAAQIGEEEQALHSNSKPGAIFLVISGAFFLIAGSSFIILGLPSMSPQQVQLVTALTLLAGLLLTGFGAFGWWRGERITLILRPEELAVPGLDRPIAWDELADLDMTESQNRMIMRLLLAPNAPLPRRVRGKSRAKLDAKRHIVTITQDLSRRNKAQDFANLVWRYRAAAQARQRLAQTGSNADVAAS